MIATSMVGCTGNLGVKEVKAYYKSLKVLKGEAEMTYKFTAKIKGKQDVNILPRVNGTLTKVVAIEGSKVSSGQVLFVIDQKPYELELQTAEANLLAAKAQLSTAKLNFESNKTLYDKKIVSKYVVETAENNYKNAQAAVSLAESQVATAKNNLSYCTITSPASGVVGNVNYRVGDLVGPSLVEPLTIISDNSTVEAYCSIQEEDYVSAMEKIAQLGNRNKLQFPALSLQLKNGNIYEYEGKVSSISGVVDPLTGCVTAKVSFPNPDGILHSGISGTVLMPLQAKDIMVIPQSAVNQLQDKAIVYVLQKDSTVKSTIVEVQDMNDGKGFSVLEGLKEGDEIIAAGVNKLIDGQKVSIKN